MKLKPIKTKRDYEAALKLAEKVWGAAEGTDEGNTLDILVLMIEAYETRHFPIPDPDPIEFLQYLMEQRELSREGLGIPADALVHRYSLRRAA